MRKCACDLTILAARIAHWTVLWGAMWVNYWSDPCKNHFHQSNHKREKMWAPASKMKTNATKCTENTTNTPQITLQFSAIFPSLGCAQRKGALLIDNASHPYCCYALHSDISPPDKCSSPSQIINTKCACDLTNYAARIAQWTAHWGAMWSNCYSDACTNHVHQRTQKREKMWVPESKMKTNATKCTQTNYQHSQNHTHDTFQRSLCLSL